MNAEHPFAPYIRILGKGPKLSRDLSAQEAEDAMRLLLAGRVEPMQIGAFLCLLRVKTETPEEVAGLVRAARETLDRADGAPPPDLDWPSYAGKSRRPPWFALAARLLARNGIRVLLHGDGVHAPDRIHVDALTGALGIPVARSAHEAGACLREHAIAYLPLEHLHPRLHELLGLRAVLGVRSPLNTALRQLNPLAAPHQMIGVAHPAYRELHAAAAMLLGQSRAAIFKGEGGEAERRPEKPCDVLLLRDGVVVPEAFAVLLSGPMATAAEPLDPRRVAAAWTGAVDDPLAAAATIGTAAIALRLLGRAASTCAAEDLARAWWRDRHRAAVAA